MLTPSSYLRAILDREAVDDSATSRLRRLEPRVWSLLGEWGGRHLLDVFPAGAFEKGTANASSINIDFVVSLSPQTPYAMPRVVDSLFTVLEQMQLDPVRRDVSIAITLDGVSVDLIPAKRESTANDVVEIVSIRRKTALKTNLTQHLLDAMSGGRREEIRILKLWRDQQKLVLPSYYLELSVRQALRRRGVGDLAENVWAALGYFETLFVARAALDTANGVNVVSDELNPFQKQAIRDAAAYARKGRPWAEIVT